MIKFLKQVAIVGGILAGLRILGEVINNIAIWDYLTQFFTLIRATTKPLDFIWDFDTSWQIIAIIMTIAVAYSTFQGLLIIRDNMKD